ncbi:MAG: hypothetical protein ACE5GW_13460, partial [Planctomycetota bacterium]
MRRGRKKAKVEHLVREELRDLIFPICLMFFERAKSVTEITEWVCEELKRRERKVPFSRQQVYPVITAAVQLGYVRFCPPWNMTLAQRIADLNKTGVENVSVVNAAGSSGL